MKAIVPEFTGLRNFLLWSVLGFLLLRVDTPLAAQQSPTTKIDSFVLNGVVRAADGERLFGAAVLVRELGLGAATDENGFFRLVLQGALYTLDVSHVGFLPQSQEVLLDRNTGITIRLEPAANVLEEVEITDRAVDYNVRSMDIGVSKLNVQSLQQIPTLLGETDVIRGLQTLPGVTTVGEGATGFNVRGGTIDQNLVLMDDIVLLNTSHLMGLFSVFHPDAVRDVTFYRGGIPARYGGKTASVLQVQLRDPATDRLRVQGGVGLVASRLTLEGPVLGDRLSVLVAGRYAYPEYLFQLLPNESVRNTRAGFYDITTRVKFQPGKRDQVWLSTYFSRDRFRIAGDSLTGIEVNASSTIFRWQTSGGSLRWRHLAGDWFSFGVSGSVTDYRPRFEIPDELFAGRFESGVTQAGLRLEGNLTFPNHEIEIGIEGLRYRIRPGELRPASSLSALNEQLLDREQALQADAYLQGEWSPVSWLGLQYGLRYSRFWAQGPAQVVNYRPGEARDPATAVDTTAYSSGANLASYGGPEPRLALRLVLSPTSSIKAGYNRLRQYLHLISNTTAALPTDRWKISDSYVRPQVADQLSVGFFQNLFNHTLETSAEFFYRKVKDMPDFRSGVNLLLLENPETAILQGEGRAYGLEVALQKRSGNLSGWVSYTYTRSELRVDSPYPEDVFFSGVWYPTNYDRPHLLNIVANYRVSETVRVSANFNYSAGRPVTYPESKYFVSGVYIPNFTTRNTGRIPDYHRLDLSVTIDPARQKDRNWHGRWTFSLYNAYARRNAFSIFFRTENGSILRALNEANAYRLSIIGTVVPSITYDFSF